MFVGKGVLQSFFSLYLTAKWVVDPDVQLI